MRRQRISAWRPFKPTANAYDVPESKKLSAAHAAPWQLLHLHLADDSLFAGDRTRLLPRILHV